MAVYIYHFNFYFKAFICFCNILKRKRKIIEKGKRILVYKKSALFLRAKSDKIVKSQNPRVLSW